MQELFWGQMGGICRAVQEPHPGALSLWRLGVRGGKEGTLAKGFLSLVFTLHSAP